MCTRNSIDIPYLEQLFYSWSTLSIPQDPDLTTVIRETKRLLERLLLNTQIEASRDVNSAVSNQTRVIPWTDSTDAHQNSSHTSVKRDSVVTSLLNQLRVTRRHRLAYLAYLKEQKNRALAQKRLLVMLQRRWVLTSSPVILVSLLLNRLYVVSKAVLLSVTHTSTFGLYI